MNRTLIIARVVPNAERQVAEIFADSDGTELPRLAGVRHRSLYRLHDLYVHLLETEAPGGSAVEKIRRHPEFIRVSERLQPFISAYRPDWRSPGDAMATCVYHWDAISSGSARP